MLIIARIDFISEICLIHSHAANGLLESRSRTKSHCPALHKHARTHTHANTHTDLPISLISTVPAARVPSVQDTDLKGHSVSPLSPEKCQLANPARLSPDCLSEQSAPVWLLKTSKKKNHTDRSEHIVDKAPVYVTTQHVSALSLKLRDSANWTEANGKHC